MNGYGYLLINLIIFLGTEYLAYLCIGANKGRYKQIGTNNDDLIAY